MVLDVSQEVVVVMMMISKREREVEGKKCIFYYASKMHILA